MSSYVLVINQDTEINSNISKIKDYYPDLKIILVNVNNKNFWPKGLNCYKLWSPTYLLVPEILWEKAMHNLEKEIEIKDNVHILNGVWNKTRLNYDQKYNHRKIEGILAWIADHCNI